MKVHFVFTGQTSEKAMADFMAEYEKRLNRFISIETVELKVRNAKNEPIQSVKEKEQREQMSKVGERDFLILLDERGKEFTSREFAAQLEKWFAASSRKIVFMTGGAYGFGDGILKRANVKISFSKFTFTHQMIRVLLLEQVYRAFTIINNQPYHH